MKRRLILFMIMMLFTQLSYSITLNHLKTFENAWGPKSVEVSPDGKWAAVMNLEGLNFWLIDTETLEWAVDGQFPATEAMGWNYSRKEEFVSKAEKPVEAAFSSGGRYLWISFHNGGCVVVYDMYSNSQTLINDTNIEYDKKQRIYVKNKLEDTSTPEYIPLIETGETPKVIAVSPDEKYVFVANWHSYNVSVIDAETFEIIKDIYVGGIPRGLAVSSDSSTLYIARMGGGGIFAVDIESLEITEEIWPAGYSNPRHLVLGSHDRYLYISDNRSGTVLKYDLAADELVAEIEVGEQARTIVLTPDEKYIFAVSHGTDEIVTIDNETMEIIDRMDFFKPMGISVNPDGNQLWITSYQGSYVSVYEIDYEE